jgi:hypothetical protein
MLDISNIKNTNVITTLSFLASLLVMGATFKMSLLITGQALKDYIKSKKSENPTDESYDNLFTNFKTDTMVKAHYIFWSKRVIIVLLVITSPLLEHYISILIGLVFTLTYTSLELEFPATLNKLEYVYVLAFNIPVVLVSFMSMLMEGHYISYDSKYISTEIMMILVSIIYILIIPLRLFDYYSYSKKQLEKRAKMRAERVPNTANITTNMNRNDLSVSGYNEEISRQNITEYGNKSHLSQTKSINGISEIVQSASLKDGIIDGDHNDKEFKGWNKKPSGNVVQGDSNSKNINIYDMPKAASSVFKSDVSVNIEYDDSSFKNYSEESEPKEENKDVRLRDYVRDLSKQKNITPIEEKKYKNFELPKF